LTPTSKNKVFTFGIHRDTPTGGLLSRDLNEEKLVVRGYESKDTKGTSRQRKNELLVSRKHKGPCGMKPWGFKQRSDTI